MKRALIAIPLASIAIGALLLLWHSATADPGARPKPRVDGPRGALPKSSPLPAPPSRLVPPRGEGELRIFVHSQGKGIAAAAVTVQEEHGPGRNSFETGADGRKTILKIPSGAYDVEVKVRGFTPASVHAEVRPNEATEVTVELKAGARIEGTVFEAGGRPFQGARIGLLDPSMIRSPCPGLYAESDPEGRYSIEGIPPGEYCVSFTHVRKRPHYRKGARLTPGQTERIDVVLEVGGTLSGRVIDDQEKPVAKATVMAVGEHSPATDTDAEGRFELFGLGEGDVVVGVTAKGHGPHFLLGVRPNTTGLEIRLPKAGAFSGTCVAEPVPEAFTVIFSRFLPHLGREVRLDSRFFPSTQGKFSVTDVAPGEYWIDIEAPGYETLDRPHFRVEPGQTVPSLQVRLKKRGAPSR